MKTLTTIFFLSLGFSNFAQKITDNWYKIESEDFKGYMHYVVEEDFISYKTMLDLKIKVEKKLIVYNANIESNKDSLMSVKSFVINGTTDDRIPEPFTFSGTVNSEEEYSYWNINEGEEQRITKNPTIADWNLFQVLTTLNYKQKGKILEFNAMEISELNYKENHYLEYVEDEVLKINGKDVEARKITHNGDRIGETTYWVDFDNKLVKISIDNEKNYTKCEQKDINFKYFE